MVGKRCPPHSLSSSSFAFTFSVALQAYHTCFGYCVPTLCCCSSKIIALKLVVAFITPCVRSLSHNLYPTSSTSPFRLPREYLTRSGKVFASKRTQNPSFACFADLDWSLDLPIIITTIFHALFFDTNFPNTSIVLCKHGGQIRAFWITGSATCYFPFSRYKWRKHHIEQTKILRLQLFQVCLRKINLIVLISAKIQYVTKMLTISIYEITTVRIMQRMSPTEHLPKFRIWECS